MGLPLRPRVPPSHDGGSAITGYRITATSTAAIQAGAVRPTQTTTKLQAADTRVITVGPSARSATIPDAQRETTYTISVKAINAIGSSAPATTSVASTPQTTITRRIAEPGAIAFRLRSSEADSTFRCRLYLSTQPGTWGPCTASKRFVRLRPGSYTFYARATGSAGNADPTPASYRFVVSTAQKGSTTAAKAPPRATRTTSVNGAR